MTGGVNSLLFGVQYTLVEVIANKRNHAKATLSDTMMVCTHIFILINCNLSPFVKTKAAVASGAFISIVVTPMEGIKARLQVQYAGDAAYKGVCLATYLFPFQYCVDTRPNGLCP